MKLLKPATPTVAEKKTGGTNKSTSGKAANEPLPRICLFKSSGHFFLMDVHTNSIFILQPVEAEVFKDWLNGRNLSDLSKDYPKEVNEINTLRSQGLFCNMPPEELAFSLSWSEICHRIFNRREHTTLELTQDCNLRCRYCVFSGGFPYRRAHNPATMTSEMVKSAIDAAFEHGKELNELFISFYGGEPLLCFNLLKEAVMYARKKSSGKTLNFAVTTNGTLLDKEKAAFLKNAEFNVLVSIDGPLPLHNRFRVFKNGRGSYGKAVEGLRTLLDAYDPESHHKIGLNMVVPSSEWFSYIQALWDDEPWLPRTLRANGVIVVPPEGLELPPPPEDTGSKNAGSIWLSSLETSTPLKTNLLNHMFNESMAKFHKRPKFPGFNRKFYPNGCCIPGVRKVFVRADGAYMMCERADEVPPIGSIEKGVDIQRIKELVDEYSQLSYDDCKNCFAISNCRLCFNDAYEGGKFCMDKKREHCSGMKSNVSSDMELYGYISKYHPNKLKEWDDYELK